MGGKDYLVILPSNQEWQRLKSELRRYNLEIGPNGEGAFAGNEILVSQIIKINEDVYAILGVESSSMSASEFLQSQFPNQLHSFHDVLTGKKVHVIWRQIDMFDAMFQQAESSQQPEASLNDEDYDDLDMFEPYVQDLPAEIEGLS